MHDGKLRGRLSPARGLVGACFAFRRDRWEQGRFGSASIWLRVAYCPGRGLRRPGRGHGSSPNDRLGVAADPDRPGGYPVDPLPARARVSVGAPGAGTSRFLEPAVFLPGEECGGVLGRALECRPGVLAVAGTGRVDGRLLRDMDAVDVGTQLRGGAVALPQRTRFRASGRGGRCVVGCLRCARG